ncbi:MAG TPA: 1-acyl-sn-glycerol-3-phosphate acyltransferase [Polyangiaceae bacterium]|nr:1-acyl-sn-glycerol-3-phosphate acyltransferase [Polyangiaceae bacterium]
MPEPSDPRPTNPLYKALAARLFSRITLHDNWLEQQRQYATGATVVHVLRSTSFVDFLALDQLMHVHSLPPIRFANDLGLGVFNPLARDAISNVFARTRPAPADRLIDALEQPGSAALLFLRRAPGVLDIAARGARLRRGIRDGDELIDALVALQRASDRPILLVPQIFLWTRRPDTRGTRPLDALLGPREWPSSMRVLGQFLSSYGNGSLRSGAPLNLKEFLEEWPDASEATLRNKLAYSMLRRLERERRSITGPVDKAPDRVRQEILRSRRFQNALGKLAATPEQRRNALEQANLMLQKMQALPDGGRTHRALEVVLDRIFQRIYHGLDVDQEGLKRLAELNREGTFILLPSHKSHIDYLVVSYVFFKAKLPLPLIVAGENLSFFPMGGIFRRGGAFFIRRTFGSDRLYTAVVDAYVRRQIKDGYAIELFLEGMRSRTGKLLMPKFGLLSMIVSAVLGQDSRNVFFVPISIGYERIVEAESYRKEISGGDKVQEDAAGLLSATDVLRHRYGRINLQFGTPQTLKEIALQLGFSLQSLTPKQTRNLVVRLGNNVMDEIARVTAVTPGALTALALLNHHRRSITHDKLVLHCERLLSILHAMGARSAPGLATNTGVLRREAIRGAVQMFLDANLIDAHATQEPSARRSKAAKPPAGSGSVYTIIDSKRVELDTSKNIIIHFFAERALLATAMLAEARGSIDKAALQNRVQYLARLLKNEFRIGTDSELDATVDRCIGAMVVCGELEFTADGNLQPGPGHDGWSGHKWLLAYAAMTRNFLEGYRILARTLSALLDGALPDKELVRKAIATGQRMVQAGEIERPEAVSKPVLQNAVQAFTDQSVLKAVKGDLVLADEFATATALQDFEMQLATYLEREGAL